MARRPTNGGYYRFDDLCILVADDNRFVRSILVTVFKALGVGKILQADNGEEAIAILEVTAQMSGDTRDIDMVFGDHLMAPVTGLELLRWIRANEDDRIKFLPFIMMSGEADVRAVTDARDAGVTEYLAKPMSVNNVASRLLAIIDRPRPFIRAPNYFGPDRRRQTLPYEGADKRLIRPEEMKLVDEGNHMVIESGEAAADAPPPGQEAVA